MIHFAKALAAGLRWANLADVLKEFLDVDPTSKNSKIAKKMLESMKAGQDALVHLPDDGRLLVMAYQAQGNISAGFQLWAENMEKAKRARNAAAMAVIFPFIGVLAGLAQLAVAHWQTAPAIAKLGVQTWQMDILLGLAALIFDYWPVKLLALSATYLAAALYIRRGHGVVRVMIEKVSCNSLQMGLLLLPTLGIVGLFGLSKLWRDANSVMTLSALMGAGQSMSDALRKIASVAKGAQKDEFVEAQLRLARFASEPALVLDFLNKELFNDIRTISRLSGDFASAIQHSGGEALEKFEEQIKKMSGIFSAFAYAVTISLIFLTMNANFSVAGAFSGAH